MTSENATQTYNTIKGLCQQKLKDEQKWQQFIQDPNTVNMSNSSKEELEKVAKLARDMKSRLQSNTDDQVKQDAEKVFLYYIFLQIIEIVAAEKVFGCHTEYETKPTNDTAFATSAKLY